MSYVPRIAAGTIQPEAEPQVIVWSLMEALRQAGLQVQSFFSRACFPTYQVAAAVTGIVPRHLDSWLMSPEMCRELFLRGAQAADIALVEGRFEPAADRDALGGKLETLCRWLDLPRLVVVDVSRIHRFGLPQRPEHVDGLLLDRVENEYHVARFSTDLETLWGVPVLGALEQLPGLRARLGRLSTCERPPPPLCRDLGDQFMRYWQPQPIWQLASGRQFPAAASPVGLASLKPQTDKLTVAIACDEAFSCYFQDTLDLLELWGASVVDFSPMRDESLPSGTDIVYLGCGHPERYADTLADNHCMKAALRSHLAAGRRIYGEGGGAAYLCQQLETPGGQMKRMVGIFPAVARLKSAPAAADPVEVTLSRPNWFGRRGAKLRGYRNGQWDIEPVGPLTGLVAEPQHCFALVGSFRAVGSLLHLNFAAQPVLLRHFFRPRVPEPCPADPWSSVF